jgi:aromatic-L-amino-acid/L-tryptophan decarboxylase
MLSRMKIDDTPLELSEAAMREMIAAAAERAIAHVAALSAQKAADLEGAEDVARRLAEPLPREGTPLDPLLDLLFDEAAPKSLNTAGPGYLGYIPGGGIFHAAAADLVADAIDRYVGIWESAPALVQIEANTIRWMCEIVGYGDGAFGVLTSGGSLANLTAVIAAREDRRRAGALPDDLRKGAAYASDQAHHSVAKAVSLAGFPRENVRSIGTDGAQRFRPDLLERRIREDRANGLAPFLLVANAGTTNTGAVDDIAALADIAAREGLWLHVDAAYGGFFALTALGKELLAAMPRADSVALDPHKGLCLPYGTGCLLVRRRGALREALRADAAYLPEMVDDERINFSELGLELTRPFRGLRLWLPLKMHGIEPFRAHLEEKLALARLAADELRKIPGVEIAAEPQLSIVAFRLARPGLDGERLDALNRRFLAGINARGRIYLSATTLGGLFTLRVAILSFRTHEARLREGLDDIRATATDALAGE